MDWMNWTLELPGMLLGLTGAVLVAGRSRRSRVSGFSIWIVSNVLLIAFSLIHGNYFIATMFMAYNLTSALGLWNNLRGAHTDAADASGDSATPSTNDSATP